MGIHTAPVYSIQFVRNLGQGGFGIVDEVVVSASTDARHPVGMRLARKRLGPQWAQDAEGRARFDREIDQLQKMKHSSIVSVEGVNAGGERFYLMPLYPSTLRKKLESKRPMPPRSVALMGFAIATALDYAHGLGIVHRDLKPDNVLLDANESPIVADWGLGQFVHQHSRVLTQGAVGGTQWYCPIEQWTGKSDSRADVYALGITLGEMLTGRIPMRAPFVGIEEDLVPTSRVFSALLRRMTARDANARPLMAAIPATLMQVLLGR